MSLPTVLLPAARRCPLGDPDPAEVITVTLGDKTFQAGRRTAAHIQWTIEQLAVQHPGAHLHIMQTCFNVGYAPSAGTHDGDGVLDFRIDGLDWWTAQWFLRQCGWASWYRHTGDWAAEIDWHLHSVSLGCPGEVGYYVPGQVDDYYRHALGLKGEHDSGEDTSRFPANIDATIFDFVKWEQGLEDDMAWKDWPLDDRKQAAEDIAAAVWNYGLGSAKLAAGAMLNRIFTAVVPQKVKK